MLLIVNNVSSYFDDLKKCLDKLDAKYVVKKYDELDSSDYDGIVLSGRTNSIKSMNVSNMKILRSAYENDVPLLGICYGLEIMALTFNGSLQKLNDRIIGANDVTVKKENMLTDRNSLNVFESHGYCIARLPKEFICLADSNNCKYEIIAHEKKHMYGTQFHPEVSKDGIEIISNFLELTKS